MLPVRAFCFDLDETLVDCSFQHESSTRKMLLYTGARIEDVKHVFESVTGDRTRDIVERFRLAAKWPDPLDDLLEVRTRAFREALVERPAVFLPGARQLLEEARAMGPIALVTSGYVGDALATLESLGVHSWFSAVVTGEDVDRPKPDPEPYRLAAHMLAIEPRHVVVFEDSAKGITSALAAGCRAVAVPRETTPVEHVAHASAVLRSMEEALPLREFVLRL